MYTILQYHMSGDSDVNMNISNSTAINLQQN